MASMKPDMARREKTHRQDQWKMTQEIGGKPEETMARFVRDRNAGVMQFQIPCSTWPDRVSAIRFLTEIEEERSHRKDGLAGVEADDFWFGKTEGCWGVGGWVR
jgi:hypothetical protein